MLVLDATRYNLTFEEKIGETSIIDQNTKVDTIKIQEKRCTGQL